jgi:uncharacterized phage infection (PIP) family protein YhgE
MAGSLNVIAEKAHQLDAIASETASAAMQQNEGITQISTAVGEMDKVTQENAAGAEESASAASELSAQAEMLKEAVAKLSQLVEKPQAEDRPKPGPAAVAAVKNHKPELIHARKEPGRTAALR